jgi:hypothetical protein
VRHALTDGRTQALPLQLAVLPDKERGPPAGDAQHQTQGAKVAVGDPQVARVDAIQHPRDPAAFLGVPILGQDDIGEQPAWLIQDHERLAGEGGRPGATPFLEAMLGRGQMIPVEDFARRARDPPRMARAQRVHHRRGEPGRVAPQGGGDPCFDPIELVIQGGGRHANLFFVRLIGRMHRRLDAEDDFTHQLHHRREQQLTRILLRRRVFEEGINPIGVQQAL